MIANLVRRLTGIARTLGADDRLTAFLNDARTAGIVFDGSKAEAGIVVETNSPTAGPVSRLAAFSATEAAAEEARRLERATELGRYAESREPRLSPAAGVEQVERNFSCALTSGSGADVIVTSVPESASLRAGFITVLQWTLRQPAGSIVACRTIVLHTAAALRKPAAAAEARLLARRFVAACGAELCARVVPLTRDDCTVSANAHAEWQQASMAREHDMRGALAAAAAVQPGLFDDRAVRDAAATAERRAEWQRETAERLAVLAAASPLQERVDVCAVLLAWSRTA